MHRLLAVIALVLTGCTTVPRGVSPVEPFDFERYVGKWYEIARLDHSFERGLWRVTAEYSPREDGGVRVINRGYDPKKDQWKESEGRAYFVGEPTRGQLKVSFFGPFYGSYVVMELDQENYGWAMVCGPNRDYLWILAREPQLPDDVVKRLVDRAKELGFETDKLIWVRQDEPAA